MITIDTSSAVFKDTVIVCRSAFSAEKIGILYNSKHYELIRSTAASRNRLMLVDTKRRLNERRLRDLSLFECVTTSRLEVP